NVALNLDLFRWIGQRQRETGGGACHGIGNDVVHVAEAGGVGDDDGIAVGQAGDGGREGHAPGVIDVQGAKAVEGNAGAGRDGIVQHRRSGADGQSAAQIDGAVEIDPAADEFSRFRQYQRRGTGAAIGHVAADDGGVRRLDRQVDRFVALQEDAAAHRRAVGGATGVTVAAADGAVGEQIARAEREAASLLNKDVSAGTEAATAAKDVRRVAAAETADAVLATAAAKATDATAIFARGSPDSRRPAAAAAETAGATGAKEAIVEDATIGTAATATEASRRPDPAARAAAVSGRVLGGVRIAAAAVHATRPGATQAQNDTCRRRGSEAASGSRGTHATATAAVPVSPLIRLTGAGPP